MDEPVETIEYRGMSIEIHQDTDPQDPRENDNLGTMVCWHSRYNLGDKHTFDTPQDFQDWLKENPCIVLPLYLYDHSGITISTGPFSCPWDSGQVGYVYLEESKAHAEYGYKHLTNKRRAKLSEHLTAEVKEYNDYLTGNVYGFMAKTPDGSDIDSCWGFSGDIYKYPGRTDGYIITEAKRSIDYYIAEKIKQHAARTKQLIRARAPLFARTPTALSYAALI